SPTTHERRGSLRRAPLRRLTSAWSPSFERKHGDCALVAITCDYRIARPAAARGSSASRQAETENKRDTQMTKVRPFLMFNDQLEGAMAFYTTTFPDSEIKNVARTGKDGPITSAEFVIGGQFFMGYNGGSYFTFSQGFSLFVDCKDQEEVDEYWNKLISAGATPSQCGWITDQFGITWQIVPRRFMELIGDKNQKKVQAVMEAMMKMVKLDVAALERAYDDA
ncbi:MAG TPA: VOC family protein, partial [Gemmatimonadaceae bacterium]|nr:VOC family protein [Gemmatimonadaceae bacterium]